MHAPVEILTRGLALSEDQETDLRGQASKLERIHSRMLRLRATVEGPGRHHRHGAFFVRLELQVPGAEIIINRQSAQTIGLAVHRAFEAAARRLEDHVLVARGFVKRHAAVPSGGRE